MTQAERVQRRVSPGLLILAWGTLGWMLLVVLWGAVVRATGSGAGCGKNWPLCNGDFFPHHPGLATIIEFTHRSTSGICTVLVLALGVWTFYATDRGHAARRAWVWSAILLVTEAIFGAVLVLRGYVEGNTSLARIVMQAIHFTNTLLLMGAMALTAWFLTWRRLVTVAPGVRSIANVAMMSTIVVGATGSLAALADTLFPSSSVAAGFAADFAISSPLLVRTRWIHPAAAVVGLIATWILSAHVKSATALALKLLIVVQLLLGIGDVFLLAPTWMQVLHLLGADLFWVTLVIVWSETADFSSQS